MHATEIIAYTYHADQYGRGCIQDELPTGPGEVFDGWALAEGVHMDDESALDELASAFGVDRMDERTFDSGDFPKVVFASQVEDYDETCGRCGVSLLGH